MMATFLAVLLLCLAPCLGGMGLIWFVRPKFIPLNNTIIKRTKITMYLVGGFSLYGVLLMTMIIVSNSKDKDITTGVAFFALVLSWFISMGVVAWLTARYKDFVFAQNLQHTNAVPTQIPTTPNPTPTAVPQVAPQTDDTPSPLPSDESGNPHSDQDWQAYKAQMEQRWQDTKDSFNQKNNHKP